MKLNRKFVLTILLIAIVSIIFIQMGAIAAFLDGGNQEDILQGDYDINYDDEGSINDIDYTNKKVRW